jgi:hypothetical protein
MSDLATQLTEQKAMLVGLSRGLRDVGRGSPPPSRLLIRAAACHFIGCATKTPVRQVLSQTYNDNPGLVAIYNRPGQKQKSQTNPARTDTATWAAELVDASNYSGVMASLAPASVFARLAARGLDVESGGRPMRLPYRADAPSTANPFVGEAAPISAYGMQFNAAMLLPHKASAISFFSLELSKRSVPGIEKALRTHLAENISAGLDMVLVGNSAPSAISPGGLLNGVTPIAASTGTGSAA